MWWGLVVSLRQPRPSSLIERYVGRNTGRRCIPVVDIYTLLVVTTKRRSNSHRGWDKMELSMTWEPAYNLAPFSFLCFSYLMCTEKRLLFSSSQLFPSFFWRVSYIHPKASIFSFFFTFVPGTHMDPDVEQKIQRGNRHCVTNPIRSNKKISTIFYRRNLKIVDETLVGRLTKRKRRKKRNAIIP